MPRLFFLLVATLVAVGGVPRSSQADDLRIGLPADMKFVVRVDVHAVQNSPVGGKLFATAKEQILGKLADKADGKGLSQEKIVEVLGFDPFEEIQNIVIAAADYDSPEQSLAGCVQLRKTSGNLEGLLLALPGYSVEDYDGLQIHSATPDGGTRVYCAFHVDAAGSRTVLLAARREAIIHMLDSLGDKGESGGSAKAITFGGEDAPLAVVEMFDLPTQIMNQEGPPANVAKIIRSLSVRVSESDDKVNVTTAVVAGADKQAEQLEQMVKGLHAMVGLAASSQTDDEDLMMIHKYLEDMTVKRDGTTVNLGLSLPAADVLKLIEDNLLKD